MKQRQEVTIQCIENAKQDKEVFKQNVSKQKIAIDIESSVRRQHSQWSNLLIPLIDWNDQS